jgi:hypothetical protein
MPPFIDLTGQKFGRLTVIHRIENKYSKATKFLCQCSCGKEVPVNAASLKNGTTKSCGCYHQEIRSQSLTTHGMSKIPLYRTWKAMMSRCYNTHHMGYPDYGGRGITVCQQWHDFPTWYAYMGEPPSKNHTIERIDNNGNYEPSNCRWATRKEQANNKSNNRIIEFNGQTKTLKQWAEVIKMPYKTLHARLNQANWSIEKSFKTPLRRHSKYIR